MKEENQNVKERELTEEQIDFRALLFKYIIHWPWFVGAVLLCLLVRGFICTGLRQFIIFPLQF